MYIAGHPCHPHCGLYVQLACDISARLASNQLLLLLFLQTDQQGL